MRIIHWVVLAILSALLTGCGGGGGGEPPAAVPVAPIANAGADQTVKENSQVTLSGSGTDSDGTIASYQWSQSGGPAVSLISPNSASTSFIAPTVTSDEVLTFSLVVTDNSGLTGTDVVKISVTNSPPVPTSYRFAEENVRLDRWGDTAQLSLTFFDQDGAPLQGVLPTWESSNIQSVTVTNAGVITSGKHGQATISAAVTANGVSLTAEILVDVVKQKNSQCTPTTPVAAGPMAPKRQFIEVNSSVTTALGVGEILNAMPIDVDSNGLFDLIVHSYLISPDLSVKENTALWMNQGGGIFSDKTAQKMPGVVFSNPRDHQRADLNGDGKDDLVIFDHGYDPGGLYGANCSNVTCPGHENFVLITQPDGSLANNASSALSPYDLNGFTHSGAAADIDCDGDVDIMEANWPNSTATAPTRLQINAGGGSFHNEIDRLPSSIIGGDALTWVNFCDLDADGDQDLVVAPSQGGSRILVNNGYGQFRLYADAVGSTMSWDMSCVDLNRDGYPEIIMPLLPFAGGTAPLLRIFKNNGDMTFTVLTSAELPNSAADEELIVEAIDLNNDGWLDLVAKTQVNATRIWWNNQGSFEEAFLGNWPGASLTLQDYDGDGYTDIHITRSGTSQLLWNRAIP